MKQHEVLAAGTISGVLGGIAMLAVAMAGAAAQGVVPALPLAVVGEAFVGPDALHADAAKVAFGALVHVAASVTLAVSFAAIVPRDFRVACAMGLGAGFALLAEGVMMSTIVPWVNPGFRTGIQVIGGTWVIATAVFGVVLGIAPAIRRRVAGEADQTAAPPGRARHAGRAGPAGHPDEASVSG